MRLEINRLVASLRILEKWVLQAHLRNSKDSSRFILSDSFTKTYS
jgi:hypothetical protein